MAEDLVIASTRGGFNDQDPAHAIADDQLAEAMNIEFFFSMCGERRAGTNTLDITGSGLSTTGAIVHLSQWYPNNDISAPELWAIGTTPGNAGATVVMARRSASSSGTPVWSTVTPVDAIVPRVPDIYYVSTKELNKKKFWAFPNNNSIDRLYVWDGSTLRLAGLGQPDPPTVVAEGSGTYSGDHFFRIRFIVKDSDGNVIRRSEPSTSVVYHNDAGTSLGVTITRPSITTTRDTHSNEGQTHWELEASADDATYYVIQTIPYGTTNVNDETQDPADYAVNGTLSESVGAYLCQPLSRFLAVDEDRLIGAGHMFKSELDSTIVVTPVTNDPGVGNDERVPIVTTGGDDIVSTYNVDNSQGGKITGLSDGVSGAFYIFKWQRIYKANRTNDNRDPYEIKMLTDQRGAIPGSVFNGTDENGAPCVYFLDPLFGPSRIGMMGIQTIRGLRTTWKRVNVKASLPSKGVFYPYKEQAIWWVAVDGSDTPNLVLRLQVSSLRSGADGGLTGGWSLADGRYAQALTASLYTEWVNDNGTVTLSSRPFIGQTTPEFIQRTDVDVTDNGTAYSASLTTKAYMPAGLLGKWGAMVGSLMATANATATVYVRLIRDFGVETSTAIAVPLAAAGSETMVFKLLDNLRMSEAHAIQIKISDS